MNNHNDIKRQKMNNQSLEILLVLLVRNDQGNTGQTSQVDQ